MLKENSRRYLLTLVVGVLCVGALGVSVKSAKQGAGRSKHVRPTFDLKRYTQDKPFRLNTLQTTSYGPAWADILLENSNFLECRGAAIALCYYSGAGPTTPCNLDGLGIANCTCYEVPAGQPYKVDMNAILNLDVYLRTVAQCGPDGSLCRPTGTIDAPVCDAINNNTLIPGADLISTFSLYLEKQLPIKPTTCSTPAAYAGCMTAPCKRTGKTDPNTGLPLVQCGCPTYTGPYQVGQTQDQCVLGGNYIWSAAYNPNMTGQ
jgi:hypothetical protein